MNQMETVETAEQFDQDAGTPLVPAGLVPVFEEFIARDGRATDTVFPIVQTGVDLDVGQAQLSALLGRSSFGSNLQSINKLDDQAVNAIAAQVLFVGGVGQAGGWFFGSTQLGGSIAYSFHQSRLAIVANRRMLLVKGESAKGGSRGQGNRSTGS